MKTHRLNRLPSLLRIFTAGMLVSAAAAMAFVAVNPSGPLSSVKTSTSTNHTKVSMGAFRARLEALETSLGATRSGEPDPSAKGADVSKKISKIHNGRAQQRYDDQAYPMEFIDSAQQIIAANAASSIASLTPLLTGPWTALGPSGVAADALVASESTPASVGTIYSGRTTAIAISPTCVAGNCALFLGAAGGGVWKTPDALAATPTWSQVSDVATPNGIPSNAIGSIVFDPSNANNIYVGTGEPNGSADSEAGVGLFKSTDGGITWSLVAGSTAKNAPCQSSPASFTCSVSTGRSIGAIAVDPADPTHIFIGTDVARHGSSSVNGGRFTPPGSALVGLYESHDSGNSFAVAKVLNPQDTVNPASPTGGDFFRGGCSHIELYRHGSAETQVYASFFDFGIFRRSNTLDSNSNFNQIFASQGGGAGGLNSQIFRTEFSLAPNGNNLRVYVGDGGLGNTPASVPADFTGLEAQFYRVDNANVSAGTLVTGGTNGGWMQLSSSTNATPGFGSFNYCEGQCSYDMPVYSPPGAPDIVYIGGASQYGELDNINGDTHRSNGRDVVRSQDAGVNFTDMTADATGTGHTPGVALHPDQHALATAPNLPNTLFIANDGGLWRVNGDTAGFFDMSGQCASRELPSANDLLDCQAWLSKVPNSITSMNAGLETLQYQSLSVSTHTANDIIGGTQDNGTHASNPTAPGTFADNWFVTVFGDGGQSGVNNAGNPETRMHTFFNAPGLTQIEVNFRGTHPTTPSELGWSWIGDPGSLSGENASFYIPLIADTNVDGTWFFGAQHVWRTQDNGGNQTFLEANCSEFVSGHGNLIFTGACGDWIPLGKDLSGTNFGKDKAPGQYIVAISRAPSDNSTLWVGLRRGRVFVASNADKPSGSVTFYRIDTSAQPERFVSGIAVDPMDPNHAFISYSGYNAYATATGTATGHVFEVRYNSSGHTATWTNIDGTNLGDQPVTGIAYDSVTHNLFISTDFGVLARSGSSWVPASTGLPPVATYGLTFDSTHHLLYAATHGRSAYSLSVP